jgi:hypothetical protein
VRGATEHFHPFGMAPSFITDVTSFGIEVDVDPSFADVVVAREDRMAIVRDLVAATTDAELARRCGEHTVLACLCTVFDEEWHHNWFANRDLDRLTAGDDRPG